MTWDDALNGVKPITLYKYAYTACTCKHTTGTVHMRRIHICIPSREQADLAFPILLALSSRRSDSKPRRTRYRVQSRFAESALSCMRTWKIAGYFRRRRIFIGSHVAPMPTHDRRDLRSGFIFFSTLSDRKCLILILWRRRVIAMDCLRRVHRIITLCKLTNLFCNMQSLLFFAD